MGYNSENIQKVKELIKTRHSEAISTSNRRKTEVSTMFPEYDRLSHHLEALGIRILGATMMKSGEKVEDIKVLYDETKQKMRQILLQNGYPADYTDVKFHCAACADSGYVDINMCQCMRSALIEAGIESSGLRTLIDKQTFDTFLLKYYENNDRIYMEDNCNRLRYFAENFTAKTDDSWLLIGATGLGKTHLSTAVAGVVIHRGFDVIYDGIQEILGVYEEERFGHGDGEQHRRGRTVERLIGCDLLIVDDLGTEIVNQFTISSMYNLLSNRMNRGKSTIINTNLTKEDIRVRYTDRIYSRLMGEFTPLLFRGRDIRAQKLMQK